MLCLLSCRFHWFYWIDRIWTNGPGRSGITRLLEQACVGKDKLLALSGLIKWLPYKIHSDRNVGV